MSERVEAGEANLRWRGCLFKLLRRGDFDRCCGLSFPWLGWL